MNTRPRLEMTDEGGVYLRTPTDGGCGDDIVTPLGHVTDGIDVPPELEGQLALLLDEWIDGISFAHGCRAAAVAAYYAGISGGLRP